MREQDAFAAVKLLRDLWPALEWPARLWPAFTAELEKLSIAPQQAEEALTALRMEHRWRTIEPADVLRALREKLPREARGRAGEKGGAGGGAGLEAMAFARARLDECRDTFLRIARQALADDPRVPAHFWECPSCFALVAPMAEAIRRAWPADWTPPERTRSWSEVSAYYRSLRADCMRKEASNAPA